MKYFADKDGSFSWRKAGTAICFILFAFHVIGQQIVTNFEPLNVEDAAIISGVFVFYFFKDTVRNIKVGTTSNNN